MITAIAAARPIWNSLNIDVIISVPSVWLALEGSCEVSSQIISNALRPLITRKTAEMMTTSQIRAA